MEDGPPATSESIRLTNQHAPLVAAGLLIILAAALFLRYQRIGADAISLDEMWHMTLSTGRGSPQMVWPGSVLLRSVPAISEVDATAPPPWDVWTGMERVLHPPLFVLTLRVWREVFGSSDLAAQWYVAAWSLAIVLLAFDFVRTISRSNVAALWTAAILAVAPTQILLSQEVRAYTMLAGLTCAAMCVAARIDAIGWTRRRGVLLSLLMLAMMLTHYFAIGVCLTLGLWAWRRLRGNAFRQFAIFSGVAALVFAVTWGPIAWKQIPDVAITGDPWLKDPSDNPFLHSIGRFFAMPVRLIVEREYPSLLWPLIGAGFLFVAFVAIRRGRRELMLPLLWFAGVCGFLLLLDWVRATRHLVFIRYSLPAGAAIAAMIPMVASRTRAALVHAAGAIVVALCLWQNPAAYFSDEPDWRVLRKFMVERVGEDEPMLFYSGPKVKGYFNEILILAASREKSLFPHDVVKLMQPADEALVASLPGETAWLFSGPIRSVEEVLPGCDVIEQTTLSDAQGRPVAVCTHVSKR